MLNDAVEMEEHLTEGTEGQYLAKFFSECELDDISASFE
jgi:hypothetical protein